MKAVIYARYSSHSQREESIEGQLRVCYEYAAREGIQVLKEYVDRAISGTTDERPAFQQMIKDSAGRSFDTVLIYAIDRFARDRYAAATYKHTLKKNGVKIIAVTQPIIDGAEGILLEALLEGLAEYYSANLSRGIQRGMYETAMKCQYTGGHFSLGYAVDPATKTFVEDPASANIVREIYQMYASGKTLIEIVNYCNEQGYRTSRGKPFSPNSLTTILRNRRYIGYYIYKDLEIENGMPALVDRELFDAVQERLKMNHRSKSRAKSDANFMLTGKIFCGHCGRPMAGTSGTSMTGEKYYYYSCRIHGNKCIKQNEKKDDIEDAVLGYITDSFLTDENIAKIADKIIEMIESEDNAAIISAITNEKKEIDRKLRNIAEMIADGRGTSTLMDMMQDLESKKRDLELQLSKAEFEKNYITKDMIMFFFSQFKEGKTDSVRMRKKILDALVNSIHVFDAKENQNDPKSSDRSSYGLGRKIVIAFNTTADVENPVTLDSSDLARMVERTSLYPNFITDTGTFFVINRGLVVIAVVDV